MKEQFYFIEQKERDLRKELYYYNIDEKLERRIFGVMEDYKYIINKLLENEGK